MRCIISKSPFCYRLNTRNYPVFQSGLFTLLSFLFRVKPLILFIFLLHTHQIAIAQEATITEYGVKAAQIYRLAHTIDWPTSAFQNDNSPIIFYIFGEDPFGDDIKYIRNLAIQFGKNKGRKITVRYTTRLEELEFCHILFINQSERTRLASIFDKIKDWPVLTVSDFEGFAERGGIINFFWYERKIRFEINVDALRRAGLSVASQVLEMTIVKVIREDEGP